MIGRMAGASALALLLGLSTSASAQNFGAIGGFNGLGAGTGGFTTPAFGFTGLGVPGAVGPFGYGGYGGYGRSFYGGYGGYGYPRYGGYYGYPAYGGYGGVYNRYYGGYPMVPQARMGNNMGGLMSTIRGTTGRGHWRR